ncbi:MAG: ATP-binding protein [Sphaerochaetaceae bacterium]|nr:ATP-binding protein [Spirochaetales bacterium]MDY5499982.1 ATP-binding protein [Sphaerochaetaceae bacterium]
MKLRTHLVLMLSLSAMLSALWAFLVANHAFQKTDISMQQSLLEREASFLSGQIEKDGIDSAFLDTYARDHAVRLTLVNHDGIVLYDNEENPSLMDNHALREEIQSAMALGDGKAVRYSKTLRTDMVYVAKSQGKLVVRLAAPISSVGTWRKNFFSIFIPTLIPFLIILLVLCILYVAHLLRPLSQLSDAAAIWGKGKLTHQLEPEGPEEFQILARTMNQEARDLARRMEASENERLRYESILDTMVEGVILVDGKGRQVLSNRAARLFHGDELLTNTAIAQTIRHTMLADVVESPIIQVEDQVFSITTAPIHDGNEVSGAVVTLNDITRIQRLEQVRRDFVANVSHELKTPLTSILGFSDILAGEHLDEEERIHYATIILKGAKRMQGIITDLLTLSSLETEGKQFPMEKVEVSDLVDDARESVRFACDQKRMRLVIGDSKGIQVTCARNLMVEAISNLLSNAIRYSPEGTEILVEVKQDAKNTMICVTDHGYGISPEDQKRIFERFYRVDKARSRSQGGTGLGLSIVRHVMLIHKGSVKVQGAIGAGSTFTLVIPRELG